MREIIFRGLGINGNWSYGLLSIIPEEYHTQSIPSGCYISNKAGKPFAYHVRPETVSQYTGLSDKNGKMIFEGDLMQTDTRILTVVYNKSLARFGLQYNDKGATTNINSNDYVIGNIHQEAE